MLASAAFVSFVPVVLAAAPVHLEASGSCPDPARISAELAAIVSSRDDAPPPSDTARVTTREGVLTVTMIGPDGALLGERRLRADGDCEAQARAVAVIVATFLADLHPEYLTLLPATPDGTRENPVSGALDPEPDVTTVSPVRNSPSPAPAPRSPSPAIRATLATRAPDLAHAPNEWLFTAAAGVQLNAEFVPAASISLSFVPGARGAGVRAFALVAGPAERRLAGDVAAFSRFPLGVGPIVRLGQRDGWFDAGAGVALGWLHVAGRTFSINMSADDVVVGAFGSVRVGTQWLAFRPFAEVGGLFWPGESVLVARSPEANAELSAFDVFFLLGAGFSL